jgi:hypothetical protein
MAVALTERTVAPNLHAVTVVGGTRGCHVPAAYEGIHSTVWRASMRLAVQAYRSSAALVAAKRARGERTRGFALHRRGGRKTEVIPLDAAQLQSDRKASADMKTVLGIAAAAPHRSGRRRHADVTFGTSLRAHGPIRIVDSPRIIDRLVSDGCLRHEAKLQWVRATNRFYLIVCWPVEPPPLRILSQPESARVVALDPNPFWVSLSLGPGSVSGLRRFQTWYDPDDGAHGELLTSWRSSAHAHQQNHQHRSGGAEVDGRLKHVERLAGRRRRPPWDHDEGMGVVDELSRVRGRQARCRRAAAVRETLSDEAAAAHRAWLRERWRKAVRERRRAHQRAAQRVADWRRHAHYDAIGFLLRQWDVVVASTAKFGTMVRRNANAKARVFGRRMAARVYGWAHFAFNQRLASAAASRGVYVHWTSEDGTSRTCGRCGAWNADLGSAETFVCVHRATRCNRCPAVKSPVPGRTGS